MGQRLSARADEGVRTMLRTAGTSARAADVTQGLHDVYAAAQHQWRRGRCRGCTQEEVESDHLGFQQNTID
jgi:hypothetical protein